jgi:DNA polymerase-4
VTIKIRRHDFSTQTRSTTLRSPIDSPDAIARLARGLLDGIDLTGGIRLLGVGVAGLTDALQDHLFELDEPVPASGDGPEPDETAMSGAAETTGGVEGVGAAELSGRRAHRWPPGVDVQHTEHGRGWVWGAGLGRVTVRFETWQTGPGPVRTFADDDPALHRAEPLDYRPDGTGSAPVAAATSPRNSP